MALASKHPDGSGEAPHTRARRMGLPERLDSVALGLGALGSLALACELGYAVFGRKGAEDILAVAALGLGIGAYARFHRPKEPRSVSEFEPRSRRERRLAERLGYPVTPAPETVKTAALDTQGPRRLRRHGRHGYARMAPGSRASHRES